MDDATRSSIERRFVLIFATAAAILASAPSLYALLAAPPGGTFLGHPYNTDDHMVYAAWMRQGMEGRLLFDNRFAVDHQPGLTIHLYFLVLGWVANIVGIPLAATLARIAFSFLFVILAYGLIRRMTPDVHTTKLALALTVFGGGVGFAVWHMFGHEIVRPEASWASRAMLGRLPTDVWQPEAFVFPSMLTNGLFMVSLCLILVVFQCLLDARDSWRPVLPGAMGMLLLMNIHSYDVLLIALVMVAFLAMTTARRQATAGWVARALAIGAGALPSALWFLHVLRNDPVFQARAETPTYSANFRQVVFGCLLLILLGLIGLAWRSSDSQRRAGVALLALLLVGGFVIASGHDPGHYWMPLAAWAAAYLAVLAGLALAADENPAWNLIAAWAAVGLAAPYFPALFQRKLAMGMSIPWAVLAALGFAVLVAKQERGARNLATVLAIVLLSASSVRWFFRERGFIDQDVSNTTVHSVYLSRDALQIIRQLEGQQGRRVAVAMPGVARRAMDGDTPAPDAFASPAIPDLNPILAGLAGVYAYAGHWSETPGYERRRAEATELFLRQTPPERRAELLARIRPDFVVAPVPESFPELPLADLSGFGEVIAGGTQLKLIRMSR